MKGSYLSIALRQAKAGTSALLFAASSSARSCPLTGGCTGLQGERHTQAQADQVPVEGWSARSGCPRWGLTVGLGGLADAR